jgi:hypothetical protein
MAITQTLYKIEYQNISQLTEDINRNFAIIQNSPLYKGIPGTPGSKGSTGLIGERGSKYFFIRLEDFIALYTGSIQAGSDITIQYVNTILESHESKQKLMAFWGITEFINQDIIVLPNSLMCTYKDGVIESTGLSFNEEISIVTTIQEMIETYVSYYVDNNPTILGIQNIFELRKSYYKNFIDGSSVGITTDVTSKSIIAPYFEGYFNDVGILADNNSGNRKYHNHITIPHTIFPKEMSGTTVLGSIESYCIKLQGTLSTFDGVTLVSDYGPGVGNIPSVVILQNDYNSGILIGSKDETNFKDYGSIFKTQIGDSRPFIIKSHQSKDPQEYSQIELGKNDLTYRKSTNFGTDLNMHVMTVVGKTRLLGIIENPLIRTGAYTETYTSTYQNDVVLGLKTKLSTQLSRLHIKFDNTYFPYLPRTNSEEALLSLEGVSGRLLSGYVYEYVPVTINTNYEKVLDKITIFDDSNYSGVGVMARNHRIPNSNYLRYFQDKINDLIQYTYVDGGTSYWRKNQYNTAEIPNLWLSNNLQINNDAFLGLTGVNRFLESNIASKTLTLGYLNNTISTLNLYGNTIKLINGNSVSDGTNYNAKVLVTDTGGNIRRDYIIENTINVDALVTQSSRNSYFDTTFPNFSNFSYHSPIDAVTKLHVLNESHYWNLYNQMFNLGNQIYQNFQDNFWTRKAFINRAIPTVNLASGADINARNISSSLVGENTLTYIGTETGIKSIIKVKGILELDSSVNLDRKIDTGSTIGGGKDGILSIVDNTSNINFTKYRFSNNTVQLRENITLADTRLDVNYDNGSLDYQIMGANNWYWLKNRVKKLYELITVPTDNNDPNDPTQFTSWTIYQWRNIKNLNPDKREVDNLYMNGVLDNHGSFKLGTLANGTLIDALNNRVEIGNNLINNLTYLNSYGIRLTHLGLYNQRIPWLTNGFLINDTSGTYKNTELLFVNEFDTLTNKKRLTNYNSNQGTTLKPAEESYGSHFHVPESSVDTYHITPLDLTDILNDVTKAKYRIPTFETLKYFLFVFNQIKYRFANTYSAMEVERRITQRLYYHVPVGTIVMYAPGSFQTHNSSNKWTQLNGLPNGSTIPNGYVLCNGVKTVDIDGIIYNPPDMQNSYIMASPEMKYAGTNPAPPGGNTTSSPDWYYLGWHNASEIKQFAYDLTEIRKTVRNVMTGVNSRFDDGTDKLLDTLYNNAYINVTMVPQHGHVTKIVPEIHTHTITNLFGQKEKIVLTRDGLFEAVANQSRSTTNFNGEFGYFEIYKGKWRNLNSNPFGWGTNNMHSIGTRISWRSKMLVSGKPYNDPFYDKQYNYDDFGESYRWDHRDVVDKTWYTDPNKFKQAFMLGLTKAGINYFSGSIYGEGYSDKTSQENKLKYTASTATNISEKDNMSYYYKTEPDYQSFIAGGINWFLPSSNINDYLLPIYLKTFSVVFMMKIRNVIQNGNIYFTTNGVRGSFDNMNINSFIRY